ncbi:hypothetical protein JNW89_35090 [Micromonospora sp. 4G55]|nr:hypothetical protein [Micromonospora sp. 4G55]
MNTTTGAQGAINTALNAVGPQGAVFVAAGTYYVKAPIVLLDKQTLVGAGPLSTLLKAASGFTGGAMVTGTATRNCIRDIGLDAVNLAANGVNLQIATKPTQYGPDPAPWLCRVFVANTTSDGIYLGGAYPGGQREFKLTDCRVEKAGGWAYNLQSSDGFVSGCSAQGGDAGGYLIGGGNIKMWGCKAYGTGTGPQPGPPSRWRRRGRPSSAARRRTPTAAGSRCPAGPPRSPAAPPTRPASAPTTGTRPASSSRPTW